MSGSYPLPDRTAGRRIILASGSPRRRELLGLLGVPFEVAPADIDETPLPREGVGDMVRRLAAAKAVAVDVTDAIVIGSDTAVEMDGEVFGKPSDPADAATTLRRLAGRTHRVHTAVAVNDAGKLAVAGSVSEVTFVAMTDADIEWYVATGEPLDKAGSYGLQGVGGVFVESVRGSVTGVLGLPMDVVIRLLTMT